jgi:5'-3' exonuclease
LLFGGLHKALEVATGNYKKWYPFDNVFMVSDSKEKSWRKDLMTSYKGTRKKDTDIDWNFVYTAYDEFKQSLKGISVLEFPRIEGDDWIAYLASKANKEGRSVIIVSNDYDIKQIVSYQLEPLFINIMTNEMFNKEKLFLPKNYQVFINKLSKIPNDDIFSLNDNSELLGLLDRFINKYEIHEVNPIESLVTKIISGDSSDNIDSIWSQTKNGKKRGIGAKGAQTIYDEYLVDFGEVILDDPDLYENIADLICVKKKLNKSQILPIVERIKENVRLIDLRLTNLPVSIVSKMDEVYKLKN